MDLATAKTTRPKPKLPPKETAVKTMLLGAEDSKQIWVVTKTKSDRVYAGQWSNLRNGVVDVQTELPFWPQCRDNDGLTLAGEPGLAADSTEIEIEIRPQAGCISQSMRPVAPGTALSKECSRIEFGADGRVSCGAVRDEENTSAVNMGDWGIAVEGRSATELIRPDGTAEPAPLPGVFGVWSAKVLFYADDESFLWTPTSTKHLPDDILNVARAGVAGSSISPRTPVLPMAQFGAPASAWLDLQTETLYTLDDGLETLARHRAVPLRFYAKRTEGDGVSLHEVDLEAGRVRQVAVYDDCTSKNFRVRELQNRQLAVSCSTMKKLSWSELVDVEQGWRSRVPGWIESEQLERDRILVSKRNQPIQHTSDLRDDSQSETAAKSRREPRAVGQNGPAPQPKGRPAETRHGRTADSIERTVHRHRQPRGRELDRPTSSFRFGDRDDSSRAFFLGDHSLDAVAQTNGARQVDNGHGRAATLDRRRRLFQARGVFHVARYSACNR